MAKTKTQGQYLRISPYLKDPQSVNVDHLGVLRDAILGSVADSRTLDGCFDRTIANRYQRTENSCHSPECDGIP
jgi:hypothetical protein